MALVSLPTWHDTDFSIRSLVTSWIAATPVQSPAATLLFISLEIILAWNKGELKQWSCSSVLRDCCTVRYWLCSEQIPGLAWPLSSRSCMSHWCPGYLCEQAALLQFKAVVLSVWIFCYLGSLWHLNLVLIVTVPMYLQLGHGFGIQHPCFFSNTPCAVGVLKQGFAGEKINFQTVHRNEGVC